MLGPINSTHPFNAISMIPATFDSLQQITHKAFEQVKDSAFQSALSFKKGIESINLHPLSDPGNLVEGGVWASFWGLCALFSGTSLYGLYQELTIEHPVSEKFAKIGKAVKTAFIDLVSLGGATAYNVHWAHDVKIISLGQYAPLMKGLGYGSSLIINIIEGGWSIYNILSEKEAILNETSPEQQEKHKQRLCLSLMKLIGNVSMIAWAALNIATIAASVAVSSMLMSALLIAACVFHISVFFYQRHIEKAPELCPLKTCSNGFLS